MTNLTFLAAMGMPMFATGALIEQVVLDKHWPSLWFAGLIQTRSFCLWHAFVLRQSRPERISVTTETGDALMLIKECINVQSYIWSWYTRRTATLIFSANWSESLHRVRVPGSPNSADFFLTLQTGGPASDAITLQ